MALQLVITNAGRAAVIDQANGGFRAVRIAAVGVSPTAIAAAATATTLPGEVKRIASIAGEATATDVVHLTVTDESDASYAVRSFALYLSDGTLFALYGQADTIVEKSAQALLLLSIDVTLAAIPAAAITFGNANFTNPAATTERAGVVELATDAEVAAGTDNGRVLTAGTAARAFAGLAGANFLGRVIVAPLGSGRVALSQSGSTNATGYIEFSRSTGQREGYIGFAPTGGAIGLVSENGAGFSVRGGPLTRDQSVVWDAGNDGAGSGLDADLLDGRHGAEFALLSGANFAGNVAVAVPGAGQVALAQSGNATHTGYVEFRRSTGQREGYIGFASAGGAITLLSESGGGFAVEGGQLTVSSSGMGKIALAPSGNATHTGYIEFRRANGVREGFFGFAPNGGAITLVSENGAGFAVTGGPLSRGGNGVWDAGNDGAGSGLDADLLDGRDGSWYADIVGRLGFTPLAASAYTAGDVVAKLQSVDGAGSGLDADLLDGRQAAEFALLTGASYSGNVAVAPSGFGQVTLATSGNATNTGYVEFRRGTGVREGFIGFASAGGPITLVSENGAGFAVTGGPMTRAGNSVWDAGNDGAGSGLDADLLDGREGAWYLAASAYNAADVLAKMLTVDGAGSGLDADLLDGWQRDDVRDWNNLLNKPGAFPPAAHTHAAADIASAFPASMSGNGYTILPNGLILQWMNVGAGTTEGSFAVTWPLAFPNACLCVCVGAQISTVENDADVDFQLVGEGSTTGATLMRQRNGEWKTSISASARLIVIGF